MITFIKLLSLDILTGLLLFSFTGCEKENNHILPAGTVADADGNIYHTVQIGNQLWMLENLKTTRYSDGTPIPLETDGSAWIDIRSPAYCWYNNEQATFGEPYGGLYNWYAVNTGDLCPSGWHVPTHADWESLTDYLMGDSIAGSKLKEEGTTHWFSPNNYATNETGFTALPGGHRDFSAEFKNMGTEGYWWSSTQTEDGSAWVVMMAFYGQGVNIFYENKPDGLSVRCLKD